jgi:hypothetical protein
LEWSIEREKERGGERERASCEEKGMPDEK